MSRGGTPQVDTPTEDTQLTEQNGGNPIEYLVRNNDDETHHLEVVIENADGTVVDRKDDSGFAPDEQLGATFSPAGASEGPYPVTVSLNSISLTIDWEPEACARFDLLVAVTANGQLEVEHVACIK